MKKFLIPAALMLLTNMANAAIHCSVSTVEDQRSMVFDQNLYSKEVTGDVVLLLAQDGKSVEPLNIETIDQVEKYKALDGRTAIVFNEQDDGAYSITVAKIDLSNGVEDSFKIKSMVFGKVTEQSPLSLILPSKKIAAGCFSIN